MGRELPLLFMGSIRKVGEYRIDNIGNKFRDDSYAIEDVQIGRGTFC